jgi:hypothetical protein
MGLRIGFNGGKMRFLGLMTAVLFLSFNTWAAEGKKKISDFKDVGGEDIEVTEKPTKGSTQDDATEAAAATVKDEKPALKENEEMLSGTVNVIRKLGMTEVFFKDLKDSYFIPSGSKNYSIYKAFEESNKKGNKVSFKANKKSRQVISIEDGSADAKKGSGSK